MGDGYPGVGKSRQLPGGRILLYPSGDTPRGVLVNRRAGWRVNVLTGAGIRIVKPLEERSSWMSKLLTTLIAIVFAAAASGAAAQATPSPAKGDAPKAAPATPAKGEKAKAPTEKAKAPTKKAAPKKAPAKPKGEAKKGEPKKAEGTATKKGQEEKK